MGNDVLNQNPIEYLKTCAERVNVLPQQWAAVIFHIKLMNMESKNPMPEEVFTAVSEFMLAASPPVILEMVKGFEFFKARYVEAGLLPKLEILPEPTPENAKEFVQTLFRNNDKLIKANSLLISENMYLTKRLSAIEAAQERANGQTGIVQ